MRIVSWNVNGLRAVLKKGFLDWLEGDGADVVCLQEIKATQEQVPQKALDAIAGLGYTAHLHPAERKGYSGVATLSRTEPLFVTKGVGFERGEGRVIITEHGGFTLYNCYFPNGRQTPDGPDPERLAFKLEFYQAMLETIEEERGAGKNVVVTGDWNTAHTEVDLARPKENETVTGFLPEERHALDGYVEAGWVDSFRLFKPGSAYEGLEPNQRDYSWWSYRGGSRDRNVGWRLDYHFVNEEFAGCLRSATIHREVMGSDHCPVAIEVDL